MSELDSIQYFNMMMIQKKQEVCETFNLSLNPKLRRINLQTVIVKNFLFSDDTQQRVLVRRGGTFSHDDIFVGLGSPLDPNGALTSSLRRW